MKKGKRFDFYRDEFGYIIAHYRPDGRLYVDELVVNKEFRGQNHGKRLAAMLPIGCILLAKPIPDNDGTISDINLIKFYSNAGFVLKFDKFNNPYMYKETNKIC